MDAALARLITQGPSSFS